MSRFQIRATLPAWQMRWKKTAQKGIRTLAGHHLCHSGSHLQYQSLPTFLVFHIQYEPFKFVQSEVLPGTKNFIRSFKWQEMPMSIDLLSNPGALKAPQ